MNWAMASRRPSRENSFGRNTSTKPSSIVCFGPGFNSLLYFARISEGIHVMLIGIWCSFLYTFSCRHPNVDKYAFDSLYSPQDRRPYALYFVSHTRHYCPWVSSENCAMSYLLDAYLHLVHHRPFRVSWPPLVLNITSVLSKNIVRRSHVDLRLTGCRLGIVRMCPLLSSPSLCRNHVSLISYSVQSLLMLSPSSSKSITSGSSPSPSSQSITSVTQASFWDHFCLCGLESLASESVTLLPRPCFGTRLLQSRYGLPHYAYLTRRTSHFLYAYHICHSPYARFVRTTSLPYWYHPLSVILVLHMIPSLLRIW